LRRTFANWGREQIQLGTYGDWKMAARRIPLKKPFKSALFWMDSSDFPLIKRKGVGRKSTQWSFKLNRPGRRYMFLQDGRGHFQRLWGGYSPKLFDGDFLDLKRRWLEEKLSGSGVVADNHFAWGKKNLKKVEFLTPFRISHKEQDSDEDDDAWM